MDEKSLEERIAEELIRNWDIIPTGNGYMAITDWRWPNGERIEVFVRAVGEREDLYVVTDGGEILNFLFSHGIDLTKDERALKVLDGIVGNYGAKIVEYQIVKGANEGDLASAVRMVLEAIKDCSFILWHRFEQKSELH